MFVKDSSHEYNKIGLGLESFYEFKRQMAKKWKELPEEGRQVYKDRFRKEFATYIKVLTQWEQEMASLGKLELLRKKTFIEAPAKRKKILKTKGYPSKNQPEFI